MNLSVSKIETYQLCPLKWYWKYVMALPTPTTPALETGTAVHELCENYLKTGKEPHEAKHGAILRAGLHLLPAPGTVRVEEWTRLYNIGAHPLWREGINSGTITIDMDDETAVQALHEHHGHHGLSTDTPFPSGTELVGKVDMYLPRLSDLPSALEPRDYKGLVKMNLSADGLIYVSDLKTTGDFRYAKSSVELATNMQMLTYAYVIGVQSYEKEGVRWNTPDGTPAGALVEHVQVRTKGQPLAKRERAFVRWNQIEKSMAQVDSTAREMLMLSCKGEAEVRDSPKYARPAACGAYGGCPFQDFCPHSPAGRARGRPLPSMTVGTGPRNSSANDTNNSDTGATTMKAASNKAALFGGGNATATATPSAGKGATGATGGKAKASAKAPAASAKASAAPKAAGTGGKATGGAGKGTGGKAPASSGKGAATAGGVGKGGKSGKSGVVPKGLNPPDAAASQPPVDAQQGVNLIRENIDMSEGALAEGFARKLIAKIGCSWDEVIEAGGFFVEDNVVYMGGENATDETEAQAALDAEQAAQSESEAGDESGAETGDVTVGEDGIPLDGEGNPCYIITELKPGKWHLYDGNGNALADAPYASWEDAHNDGWAWASEGGESGPAEAGDGTETGGEMTGADLRIDGYDYTQTDGYAQADAQAKVTIDALWAAVNGADGGVLSEDEVNEIVKTNCNVKRLHKEKTRDPILALGVEISAFEYHGETGGLAVVGTSAGTAEAGDEGAEQGGDAEAVAASGDDAVIPDAIPGITLSGPPLVILVDALALGQNVGDLAGYLVPWEDEVAAQGLDVRGQGADYGKGGKSVASKLLVYGLKDPLTGWWAISSRHPYVEEVLAVLARFGAVVVRGVR